MNQIRSVLDLHDASPRGRLLAYLADKMQTAWHVAMQHTTQTACEFIAERVNFRKPEHFESTDAYAKALTRYLEIHDYHEAHHRLVAGRVLTLVATE